MATFRRRLIRLSLGVVTVCIAVFGLSLWNKADYCRGWASHHLERCVEYKTEHVRAIRENRDEDARILARAVIIESLVAEKYLRVANNPLRPYPSYPLVTDEEIAAHFTSGKG